MVIGLGTLQQVDSMIVTWPDRSVSSFKNPTLNKEYVIDEVNSKKTIPISSPVVYDSLFKVVKAEFDKHEEDNNVDFYFEKNVPKMLSREGPKAAVGDVNGDGLEDVFIGGTAGHPGQLYLQSDEGKFIKKTEPGFELFNDFEDEAVLFFDADHDGDLDLFIGPGGNNNPPASRQMQFRLFINDGKGNFTIDANAFPGNLHGANTAIAIANDFNQDGYPDLFIGARSIPREYGSPPESFLFLNDGHGHFKDIAATKNPDIAFIGMVTDAVWANVSGDKAKDLVICGEWMAPRIFSFRKDHFEERTTNLNNLFGWWQSIAAIDVNKDGKTDLVLGNVGENFYLRPDSANPVKIWINDFDHNGNIDNILTRTIEQKDMPVFLKHDMEAQIPSLKKQNLKHGDYAKKSIQDLFPSELLGTSLVKLFNYCPSVLAINDGNGQFTVKPLPQRVQFSSVNAIQSADLNGDGNPDLIMGGNEFGLLPQFGRLDGSYGQVLINDGKGGFSWMDNIHSGLFLPGQTRDIVEIKGKNKNYFLFLENDEFPVLYELNNQVFKGAVK
jgi:enediyne biosynthesis protein E4